MPLRALVRPSALILLALMLPAAALAQPAAAPAPGPAPKTIALAESQFQIAAPVFGHAVARTLEHDPSRMSGLRRLQEVLLVPPAGRGFTMVVLREMEPNFRMVERQQPRGVARTLSQRGLTLDYGEQGSRRAGLGSYSFQRYTVAETKEECIAFVSYFGRSPSGGDAHSLIGTTCHESALPLDAFTQDLAKISVNPRLLPGS